MPLASVQTALTLAPPGEENIPSDESEDALHVEDAPPLSALSELCTDPATALIPYYAELICAEGLTEKLFALRFNALQTLGACLKHYSRLGYAPKLLKRIADRKAALILAAANKTELDRILRPKAPHFDGVHFIPDRYMLPEEELICWSETSLRAPLNEAGYRRYLTLFRQVFPAESEALNLA